MPSSFFELSNLEYFRIVNVMEPRLAIHFTAKFFEQLFDHEEVEELATFTRNMFENANLTGKKLEKMLIATSRHNGFLKSYLVLKKFKSFLFLMPLVRGDINPLDKRKERVVFTRVISISRKAKENEGARHAISHHCIQRIFERLEFGNLSDEKSVRERVLQQFDYLPIFEIALNRVITLAMELELDGKEIEFLAIKNILNGLSISIPTADGILKAEYNPPSVYVRTFLPYDLVPESELNRSKKNYKILKLFKDSPIIFYPDVRNFLSDTENLSELLFLDVASIILIGNLEETLGDQKIDEIQKRQLETLLRLVKNNNTLHYVKLIINLINNPKNEDLSGKELSKIFQKELRKYLRNN
jgi:hypothetical protein